MTEHNCNPYYYFKLHYKMQSFIAFPKLRDNVLPNYQGSFNKALEFDSYCMMELILEKEPLKGILSLKPSDIKSPSNELPKSFRFDALLILVSAGHLSFKLFMFDQIPTLH